MQMQATTKQCGMAAALVFALAFCAAAYAQQPGRQDAAPPSVTTQEAAAETSAEAAGEMTVPFAEIRLFAEVFARVKRDYVEPVDDKLLMENAIRGLLSGLDPHSDYLSRQEYKDTHEDTAGEFGGLGIEVGLEDGFVRVIAPIDDTPADKAGVRAGDIIIRLDGKSIQGLDLDESVGMMRGEPGAPIVLTIVREGEERPIEITVVRDIIKVRSVRARTLQPGYVYLRVTQFQSHTARLLRDAVERLGRDNPGGVKGAVLDLRNNPGGSLDSAVEVSDAFLQEGLIVYTQGRTADSETRFHARPGDIIDGAPLVAIVNGGSASASEIVAGALQDHGRAVILGEKTFGKGSVQVILPMSNGEAIKLTTARYYTPSGRSIQALGVAPDIDTRNLALRRDSATALPPITESRLSGHLENATEGEADDAADAEAARARAVAENRSLAETDYPLYEALNLLKSLTIAQSRMAQP